MGEELGASQLLAMTTRLRGGRGGHLGEVDDIDHPGRGLLAIVAAAAVVFFATWSRRSKPTHPEPERPSRHVEPDGDARDLP